MKIQCMIIIALVGYVNGQGFLSNILPFGTSDARNLAASAISTTSEQLGPNGLAQSTVKGSAEMSQQALSTASELLSLLSRQMQAGEQASSSNGCQCSYPGAISSKLDSISDGANNVASQLTNQANQQGSSFLSSLGQAFAGLQGQGRGGLSLGQSSNSGLGLQSSFGTPGSFQFGSSVDLNGQRSETSDGRSDSSSGQSQFGGQFGGQQFGIGLKAQGQMPTVDIGSSINGGLNMASNLGGSLSDIGRSGVQMANQKLNSAVGLAGQTQEQGSNLASSLGQTITDMGRSGLNNVAGAVDSARSLANETSGLLNFPALSGAVNNLGQQASSATGRLYGLLPHGEITLRY